MQKGSSHDWHEFLGHRLAGGQQSIYDTIAPSKEIQEDLSQKFFCQHPSVKLMRHGGKTDILAGRLVPLRVDEFPIDAHLVYLLKT